MYLNFLKALNIGNQSAKTKQKYLRHEKRSEKSSKLIVNTIRSAPLRVNGLR